MTDVWIDKDTSYDWFIEEKEPNRYLPSVISMPAELVERYKKALTEWRAVQSDIDAVIEGR